MVDSRIGPLARQRDRVCTAAEEAAWRGHQNKAQSLLVNGTLAYGEHACCVCANFRVRTVANAKPRNCSSLPSTGSAASATAAAVFSSGVSAPVVVVGGRG